MKLENLTINFLGDSITEGCCASAPSKSFVSLIAQATGCVCRNYGIGGTRIARQSKASTPTRHDLDFPSRVPTIDHDADLIVVFGGTNDFGHGDAPLGVMGDRDVYTFFGALECLYSALETHYRKDQIVILTPLRRFDCEDCNSLDDYVNAIRQVAKAHELTVFDLYEDSVMHPRTPDASATYFDDGLHPNDFGYETLANEIMAFLEKL